jgi:hypothetical protein
VFNVFGGTLDSDFGNQGGLVTIGLSFSVPSDFTRSFGGFATTQPFPVQVPEPSTSILCGIVLLGLGVFSRKKLIAHSLMGRQNR